MILNVLLLEYRLSIQRLDDPNVDLFSALIGA